MGLMLFIFDGLKQASPEMLMRIIVPLVVSIVLAVIGMYIFSSSQESFKGQPKFSICCILNSALWVPGRLYINE